MRTILCWAFLGFTGLGFIQASFCVSNVVAASTDQDKIAQAKQHILEMVIRSETVRFHDEFTKVNNNNNTVTIKFTFQNGFGLIETRTMDIKTK